MKNLFKVLILVSLSVLPNINAQSYASALLLTNTPVALFTDPATVRLLTLTATTANNTVFKFYDNNDATAARTNIVFAATTNPLQYTTNWTSTFTNTDNVVITNTFSGLWVTTQVQGAVTNERPRTTYTVPASSTRVLTVSRRLAYGLVVQANYEGLVEVEYDPSY